MSKLIQPYILVVESDEVDRSVIERGLCRAGRKIDILFALDGEEAIAIVERAIAELPSLILLSMHLPKIDGDELLIHFKSSPKTARIPILAMVNPGNDLQCDQALANGALGTIEKTFEFEEFQKTLSSIAEFVTGETNKLPRPISIISGAELL